MDVGMGIDIGLGIDDGLGADLSMGLELRETLGTTPELLSGLEVSNQDCIFLENGKGPTVKQSFGEILLLTSTTITTTV